ncbi:hypothetical protein AB0P15_01815 [Streptomyces sp. NPDC087917]|uniref:hypothetical protein n=1 Tax=Streptomyces sp. NPDC087917 TaxID=3155060 RepID=UPI003412CE1B
MWVEIEAVRQDPATPMTVRVRSAVGTVVVFWQGATVAVAGDHHVEWTVDEDIVWSLNAGPAPSARSELSEDGDRIVFQGRLSLTEDGAAVLDVGGTLILFDVAGPLPPDGADGAWIQVRVGRGDVSVWPHQL